MARPTNTQFAVAVHILTLLAGEPDAVQSSELLAVSVGANPVHIRRVLGTLRRAGLVGSRPGAHGGWQLRPAAAAITLGDVWRAVQGDDQVLGLHGAAPDCKVGQRIQHALGDIDRRAARALEAELTRTTVAELAHDTRAREAARPRAEVLGEAIDVTAPTAAEPAQRLARGEGRPGTRTPAALFGSAPAEAAGGEFVHDQP